MKNLLIVLLLLLSIGCGRRENYGIVVGKTSHDYSGDKLPDGLCRFVVTGARMDLTYEFTDSCHYYHALDTIKPKTVRR